MCQLWALHVVTKRQFFLHLYEQKVQDMVIVRPTIITIRMYHIECWYFPWPPVTHNYLKLPNLTARRYTRAVYAVVLSVVCPSVRLSVCSSQASIYDDNDDDDDDKICLVTLLAGIIFSMLLLSVCIYCSLCLSFILFYMDLESEIKCMHSFIHSLDATMLTLTNLISQFSDPLVDADKEKTRALIANTAPTLFTNVPNSSVMLCVQTGEATGRADRQATDQRGGEGPSTETVQLRPATLVRGSTTAALRRRRRPLQACRQLVPEHRPAIVARSRPTQTFASLQDCPATLGPPSPTHTTSRRPLIHCASL